HHPGLRRKILSPRHAALRPERALDPGCDAECRRAHLGGLADQYQDAGSGLSAAEILGVCGVERDDLSDPSPFATAPLPLAGSETSEARSRVGSHRKMR